MCTAVSWNSKHHFFGRNLDLEYAYQEQVVVMPRNFPITLRCGMSLHQHFAMIGMATVSQNYPLYYDATNECGLSMAGLSFRDSAIYRPKTCGKQNLAPFEVIPWILGQCKSVSEAKELCQQVNIWALPFNREFPLTGLHWIVSDASRSIVLEPTADGLRVYENPIGILTNEPPLPFQLIHLSNHMQLHPGRAINQFPNVFLQHYSNGMGAIGLPGDFSSQSRFVRAAFVKCNMPRSDDGVTEFFHILRSVQMPTGSVMVDGKPEITRYSSCCDTECGIYYYTTYRNSRPRAVQLMHAPLEANVLTTFDLLDQPEVFFQN